MKALFFLDYLTNKLVTATMLQLELLTVSAELLCLGKVAFTVHMEMQLSLSTVYFCTE